MKTIIAVAVLGLAGCTFNPAELRQRGEQHDFTLKLPPQEGAACVARNAENAGDAFLGTPPISTRPGAQPRSWELVTNMNGATHFVADFDPRQAGSIAHAWVSPYAIPTMQQRFLSAFDGC